MGSFIQLYNAAVKARDSRVGDWGSRVSSGWPIQSGGGGTE